MSEPAPRLIRTPRDAEQAACDWMRYMGFDDARLTNAGADGGVDVESAAAVAQVKAEMRPIGRPVVQQLVGVASVEAKTPLFFSLSGFTPEAETWGMKAGVALFEFDLQGEPEPKTQQARNVLDNVNAFIPDEEVRPYFTEVVQALSKIDIDGDWSMGARPRAWEWTLSSRVFLAKTPRLSLDFGPLKKGLRNKLLKSFADFEADPRQDSVTFSGSPKKLAQLVVDAMRLLSVDPKTLSIGFTWYGTKARPDNFNPKVALGMGKVPVPRQVAEIVNLGSDGFMRVSFPEG